MYSINFTVTKKKFCLNLHYNGANIYLFVNGIEIYKLKTKDSEIVASTLCLESILKDWSTSEMNLCFFHLALKQVNIVVVVIILSIRMQKICVPDIVKNFNVKGFNLMSRTNETK